MLKLLAGVSLFALTTAAPLDKDSEATIIKNEFTIDGKGSYKFSYETSNGLTRWEEGNIENEGQPNEHIVVNGYYIYYDPDGKKQMVQYSGDENGFHILPEWLPPCLHKLLHRYLDAKQGMECRLYKKSFIRPFKF